MDFINQIGLHVIILRGSAIQQNKFVNIKLSLFDLKNLKSMGLKPYLLTSFIS